MSAIGATRRHSFLWIDMEMTGLDPHAGRILEWAVILAADDRGGDMRPVREYTSVVGLNAKDWDAVQAEMDPFVLDMHTKNGLLAECITSTTTLREGEQFLVALCQELTGDDEPRCSGPSGPIVLAGSSVASLDHPFIKVHMPAFAKWLSHRCFDVSTLKMAERDWAGEKFKKAEAHRALPDIRESLEHAAEIRAKIERWT